MQLSDCFLASDSITLQYSAILYNTLQYFTITLQLLFGLRFQYFVTNHAALHSYNSFSNRRGRNMKTSINVSIENAKEKLRKLRKLWNFYDACQMEELRLAFCGSTDLDKLSWPTLQ